MTASLFVFIVMLNEVKHLTEGALCRDAHVPRCGAARRTPQSLRR
jgi:hypothetical protein